jgi:sulfur relay (sulfurtransferase) complex TusBCD TusD component (DsrE family)
LDHTRDGHIRGASRHPLTNHWQRHSAQSRSLDRRTTATCNACTSTRGLVTAAARCVLARQQQLIRVDQWTWLGHWYEGSPLAKA